MYTKFKIERICSDCGHHGTTCETKGKIRGIVPCPKCNGTFVDKFLKAKYERDNNKPLLVIVLEDESSVPKVLHKGKEIKFKTNVRFEWETDTDIDELGGLTYSIEHHERTGVPTLNKIERKIKGHAFD